jgi:hypothetical protein
MGLEDRIRVEYEFFDEVQKWPRNPKDHDLHEIRKSFVRFGFTYPILLDEGTGKLVAGHGRLDTLQLMFDNGQDPPKRVEVEDGRWKVPVLKGVRFDNFAEAEAYLLADNRLSEIGGWKLDILSVILSEIVDVDGALDGIGYDIAEVMDIIEPVEKGSRGESEERISNRKYFILVPCRDEDHQSDLLETLLGQGIDCRGVVE